MEDARPILRITKRPATEDVDESLNNVDDERIIQHDARVLAAEVRALREELAVERGAAKPVLRAHIQDLEAAIARVEEALNVARSAECDFIMLRYVRKALRGEL